MNASIARGVFVASSTWAACFASALTYDVCGQFSVTQGNPNGAWSYGYKADGATNGPLVLFDEINDDPLGPWYGHDFGLGTPAIWKNLRTGFHYGVPPGMLALHPGPQNQLAVARLTFAQAGEAWVRGGFGDGDGGSVDVYVAHTADVLVSATGIPGAQAFDFRRNVAVGDTIDFMVGNAGNVFYDDTPIEARVDVVPEPASAAALVFGLAGLRRRRPASAV